MAEDAWNIAISVPEYSKFGKRVSAHVTLQNSDRFDCKDADEIFLVRVHSANPIREVVIEGGLYGVCRVEISIGGRWSHSSGATIDISSDETFARDCEIRFDKIFRKSKPLDQLIPSTPSIVIAAVFTIFLGYLTNAISLIISILSKDPALTPGAAFVVAATLMVFIFPIQQFKLKYFGKAVFNWGDGETRFERNLKIANYIFWTLPAAIVLKTFIKG